MRRMVCALTVSLATAAALVLTASSASAWQCDFLTGGGFIMTTASHTHPLDKANFAIAGGCKKNVPDQHGPFWGHLEYIDHNTGLNVHWETITAYIEYSTNTDGQQPTGARIICGTARTNQPYGDVYFKVFAEDKGEPGKDDVFIIRLKDVAGGMIVYTTEGDDNQTLGGGGPGGGNIQLHANNPSNVGDFGGVCLAE